MSGNLAPSVAEYFRSFSGDYQLSNGGNGNFGKKFQYDFPRPAYTADVVVFNNDKVLLMTRATGPFKGMLALPGGHVHENERSIDAAIRELREETGLFIDHEPKLIGVFDDPDRDPRGWVISTAYRCRTRQTVLQAGDDAVDANWHRLDSISRNMLAFDHYKIICKAWEQEGKLN